MGQFFTATQIYDPESLSITEFTDRFRKKMHKAGYVPCAGDESELSYILRSAANCKWVTITSGAYAQGDQLARQDTGRIAKMLKTPCISTTVIDSDCAVLALYDENGKKADLLRIGRADDIGDDRPQPSEKLWKPFFSSSTWEQFAELCKANAIFVEDSLAKLAGMLGMDSENILFSAADAQEDAQTVFLYFKKATKKEKKPTLSTYFQQIWGEVLEPLGFRKPKLRQPYYIRVVNDEILHIVGICDRKTHLSVFGGIATVYREDLCLDRPFRQNEGWLKRIMHFYVTWHISDQPFHPEVQSGFPYAEHIASQTLPHAVQRALNETLTWIIPVFDNIQTLQDVADYEERQFKNYTGIVPLPLQDGSAAPYCDSVIKYLLDDPLADLEERYERELAAFEEECRRFHHTEEYRKTNRAALEQHMERSRQSVRMFLEDAELRRRTLEEVARRKERNLGVVGGCKGV